MNNETRAQLQMSSSLALLRIMNHLQSQKLNGHMEVIFYVRWINHSLAFG